MKTALITTTINVPKVLSLYRRYGPDVVLFVAGDEKTPKDAVEAWMTENQISHMHYYAPSHQKLLNYKCSELIGWNCIQRRNIALLEAVKWGANTIITVDDDNIPLDKNYFVDYDACRGRYYSGYGGGFEAPRYFDGIKVSSPNGWFDPGQLLTPAIRHRGIPIGVPTVTPELSTITDAKIGVMAGLWVGDADVDATHRIANPPAVTAPTALAEAGVVVDHGTWTVWNAQNVGFIRELAPAMFQMPGIGRADDIFASLITQRIMREHNLYAHIGKPFTACWQKRSTASMIRDLEEELFLYRHIAEFATVLDHIYIDSERTILQNVQSIYGILTTGGLLPTQATDAALAFLDDLEKVL